MSKVLIFTESRFLADRKRIRAFVEKYLQGKVSAPFEICVSIVGDRKMKQFNSQYRKKPETAPVLSFPLTDPSTSTDKDIRSGFSPNKSSPDGILRLGDVVISYPQAVLLAAQSNILVDVKIEELLEHGLDRLLGKHSH